MMLEGFYSMAAPDEQGVSDVVFDGVCKSYGSNQVLYKVSFCLEGGSATCLMAPSGSGKTTLLRLLLGLEQPDEGHIKGVSIGQIAMMFQEDRLCETLSAIDNVALVLPPNVRRSDVREILRCVLPDQCLDQPVMELSGGMRRRVSLVRAVAFPSRMVVLDEPFTGLDNTTRKEVIEFLLEHLHGRTLLVATHGEDDARMLKAQRLNLEDIQERGLK